MGAYQELVVADGATHLWILDEISGLAQDSIGTVHATSDSGLTRGQPPVVKAESSWSMRFEGALASGIVLSDAVDLAGVSTFTLEAWLLVYSYNTNGSLFINKWQSTDGWRFDVGSVGALAFQRTSGSLSDVCQTNQNVVPLGKPVHLAVTYNGTDIQIYRDGVARTDGVVGSTRSLPGNAVNLTLGKFAGGGSGLDGRMGFVAAYEGVVLTEAQLLNHRNTGAYERMFPDWSRLPKPRLARAA